MTQDISSIDEFITQKDIQGYWPYLPSGILKQRSRKPSDSSSMVDKQWTEFESAVKFVDNLV